MTMIERIWRVATRKRKLESDAAEDERLTTAIEANACTLTCDSGRFPGEVLCGRPLNDGICAVHK